MNRMMLYSINTDLDKFKTYHSDLLYKMYGMYADIKMNADDLSNMVSFDEFCQCQFEEHLNDITKDVE